MQRSQSGKDVLSVTMNITEKAKHTIFCREKEIITIMAQYVR